MDTAALSLEDARDLYSVVSRMDGSAPYRAAVARIGAKTLGDVVRVQSALFARLSAEIPGWAESDLAEIKSEMARIGAIGGAAGRGKSKRRSTSLTSKAAKALVARRQQLRARRGVSLR
jgi:hypothetical protein